MSLTNWEKEMHNYDIVVNVNINKCTLFINT